MTKSRGFAIFIVVIVTLTFIAGTTLFAMKVTQGQQPEALIDYNTLTTNREKLAAVESLIGTATREYNQQSATAAAAKGTLDAKFRTYVQTKFQPVFDALIAERLRLRGVLFAGQYDAGSWQTVSANTTLAEQEQLLLDLFGNKTAQQQSDTEATSAALSALLLIDLEQLSSTPLEDPLEDFTTYTEYDEGSDITVAANTITATSAESRADTYYVYDDKGASHFSGDWEHRFECAVSAFGGNGARLHPWALTEDFTIYEDIYDRHAASDSLLWVEWAWASPTHYYRIFESYSGTWYFDTYNPSGYGTFFNTISRSSTTYNNYVCTGNYYGESGSSLEDTLTLTLQAVVSYRYVYGISSWDTGSTGYTVTGTVDDLDLQEPSCPDVDTDATDDIEDTTATLNGDVNNINDSTIDDRGFVWGTTSNATTPGCGEAPEDTNYDNYWTEAGTFGTGVFDHGITGLATATTHYARAAANNSDANWGWGNEVSWLTKPAAPTNVAASDGSDTAKVIVTWTKSSGTITGYKVYRDGGLIDTVGDVATYDDTGADAPTITPGSGVASDGTYGDKVNLSVSGDSANVGTTHTYKVRAYNAAGDSDDSATDTGYRGVGTLTYQWYVSWNCSAGNYSQIGGGTTDPYDYMNAPAPTITANNATACDGCSGVHVTLSCNETTADGTCNYYLAELSATGANSQNCTSDSGYKGATAQTFQWWRSWNATAGNYSQIAGGTTDPYNDTGGATTPDYRWYLTTISMTGATSVNSSADSGYMSGVNVTAVYVYPAYDQEPTSTNQSLWCIVWDDEGLGVGYNVSWNTSGVGSILWCENWTGPDGRADLICTSNVTGNQTICAESNGFSDCGLTLWTQGTGQELPVWYFVLLGCAIVGAWYTKDIILFVMGIVASGGMIYWVEQSSLDDRIRYALIAVFVILAGVLLVQMIIRGQFSFVRGGDSE